MKLPRIARVDCDGFDYSIFATDDFISQAVFRAGTWEPTVHATSSLLLNGFKAPMVVDVGANIGLFTIPVASRISAAGGKLFAFEAQRIVFQQLCGNIFANRLDNVWAFHKAVGAHKGEVELPAIDYAKVKNIGAFSLDENLQRLRGLEEGLDRSRTERIELTTLDNLDIDGRVRLLKVDVEGMELDVLRGGHQFLERHRFPPILFEAWEDEAFADGRKTLFNEVVSLGYSTSSLGRDNFLAQHPDNEALVQVRRDGNKTELSRIK